MGSLIDLIGMDMKAPPQSKRTSLSENESRFDRGVVKSEDSASLRPFEGSNWGNPHRRMGKTGDSQSVPAPSDRIRFQLCVKILNRKPPRFLAWHAVRNSVESEIV